MTLDRPLTEAEAIQLVRCDPGLHFVQFTHIKKKSGKTEKPEKCNVLQERLFKAYVWLTERGLPVSIIILKPRQSGGSVATAELVYHHSRRFNLGGFMMADNIDRTGTIWDLFCGKLAGDSFDKFWGNKFSFNTERAIVKYPGGTAIWDRGTANDDKAGASGTRQIVWLSESARYAKEGRFQDHMVIGNVMNSIPPGQPNTLRIAESTAQGTGGWHHDTYEGGVTLEERMAGKVGNGWIKIFMAWHECEDYALHNGPQDHEYYNNNDSRWVEHQKDEEAGKILYGWTQDQIAFRRMKIIGEANGDAKLFKREFPASASEAWSSSGSKRFDVVAVAKLMVESRALWKRTMANDPTAPKLGSLIDGAGGVVFLPSREDAWLWVGEEPRFGRSYSLIVDPMTGAQAEGSDKPDNHAVGVMRNAFADDAGLVYPAELVATIHVPGGCRWDIDILADKIVLLSRWYGRCIVIPEVNKAMDLIPPLKAAGVTLYQRPVRPDNNNPSMRQTSVGFLSTESSRALWVSAAAAAIRESTVGCLYYPAVQEIDTFIVRSNGRAEAASGTHDDWVAMFGIGALTIGAATRMMLPVVQSSASSYRQHSGAMAGKGRGAIW